MTMNLNGQTITDAIRGEWLKARGTRIGASEIASAIGINQYDSQLRLWLSKTGKLPPKEATPEMEVGSALESAILDLYGKRYNQIIARTQVFYASVKYDYLCATLDGITDGGINVQVKNVGCQSAQFWGQEETDDIPHNVIMQVNQEMLCAGLDFTHVVALIGGNDLRVYHIQRDEKIVKHIIKLGREFMERVRTLTYPEPDKNKDHELIKYLFPECTGSVEFDAKQSADVIKWERVTGELKVIEQEVKQLKMGIVMAMGEASQATLIDGRILYRNVVTVPARIQEVKGYSFARLTVK